jgi:hypothetical protein
MDCEKPLGLGTAASTLYFAAGIPIGKASA